MIEPLDRAYETIRKLASSGSSSNHFDAGYNLAIKHALDIIHAFGGMDPVDRLNIRDTRAETIRDYRL